MESFKHNELTFASYEANDNGQRIKVFRLEPFSVKPFRTRNMLIIQLECEIMGQPRKIQMFVPMGTFSRKLGRYCNDLFGLQKGEVANPGHLTIEPFCE